MEYEVQPETFKRCSAALTETFARGKASEREQKLFVARAHRAMLEIIHDLSDARPSAAVTQLAGKVKRALRDLHPKRDFSLREAILAELAFICETLARIKFGMKVEDIGGQGLHRMSEAKLFCIAFADELAVRRTRKKRPKKRRRARRKNK